MENHEEIKGISVKVTEEEDCRKVINIEVETDLLDKEREKVLSEIVKETTIPGFRKGKAPRDMVQKKFEGDIHAEAIKNVLPKAYGHALYTEKIHPIGEPVFRDIDGGVDSMLSFNVDVETAPEIELTEYKGLAEEPEKVEVQAEEIDKVVDNLREREVDFKEVEREATTEDMVVIDYAPVGEDGEPDEEKRMKDYPVQLGAGQLFPEFELAIVGKSAGDEGEAEIAYPDDFKPERLAGLKIKYMFTVKAVKEKHLPEVDDDFVKKLDEKLEGVEGLRSDIEKRLLDEKEREARRKVEEQVIDAIIEKNSFQVPRSMIERFKKELEKEDVRRREAAGAPPEEDEEKKKEIDEFFDKIARRNIKRYFLVGHVAALEGIDVNDEDMDKEIERMAEEGGRPLDEVKKIVGKGSENYDNLRARLREKKVFDALLEK